MTWPKPRFFDALRPLLPHPCVYQVVLGVDKMKFRNKGLEAVDSLSLMAGALWLVHDWCEDEHTHTRRIPVAKAMQ